MQLPVPIGLKTGWVGAKPVQCGSSFGADGPAVALKTVGFPLWAPVGNEKRPSRCYESSCRAAATCEGDIAIMEHSCDATSGQSGAPMLDASKNVRAVHVQGVSAFSNGKNLATPFTPFILDIIKQWTQR